ncbi:hypothetical protein [Streptomyces sp. NBC_00233]|uniref:hypothetical protein n=1 Tax=Streptomyces sp. NBC_00233 TaxID=2975686 RepID=UPI0022561088|nr:hypothetical protein [Streptomyces sp. NBC_00233]MCX5230966.1 hypothetical protein [Streptomyces sp. NBC_00233]
MFLRRRPLGRPVIRPAGAPLLRGALVGGAACAARAGAPPGPGHAGREQDQEATTADLQANSSPWPPRHRPRARHRPRRLSRWPPPPHRPPAGRPR